VKVEVYVDLFGEEDRAGGAAGDDGLEFLAVLNAARDVVDGLLEVVAHGQLVDAGALDVTGDSEEAWAGVALAADLGVLIAAHQEDVRSGGDGLGVVDDCGSAIEADDGGEGRLDAGDATLALE